MIADELIIKVMADTRDAVVNLTKMTGEAGKAKTAGIDLQNAFAKMRDIMQGPVAMFQQAAKALEGLWNQSQEFFDAYAEGEDTFIRFNLAMENSDRLYKGAGDRIEALIQKIKRQTYYGDDQLRSQAALLVSYGRTEEEIKKIITVATDMAAATGESLPDAINKLNMTLNGNIGRMGMTYGEIKKLTAEQLAAGDAVDILGAKFAGMGATMSKTAAGMKKDIADMVEDAKENLGTLIAEFQNPVMEAILQRSVTLGTGKTAEAAIELIRQKGVRNIEGKAVALQALNAFRDEAMRIETKLVQGQEITTWERLNVESYRSVAREIAIYMTQLEMASKKEADEAIAAEKRAKAAEERAATEEAERQILEETERIMSRVVDYEHDRADVHGYIERAMAGAYEEAEKIADTMEEIVDFSQAFADEFDRIAKAESAPGGGAVGVINNYAEAMQNLQKAMGGGAIAPDALTADKILQPGGNNPQFDWKSTGGDQWDMYASPQVDAINAGMAELAIQRQLDDILGDKATKAREIVGLYRQAEQIESIAAQTAREKAEAEKAFADWQKQWIDQLGSTGIDILMEAAHALDVARAVGWEEAAQGFDQYMVRLIDQLPMMLLTAGLQVMPYNWPVGVALIAASGLVALVDALHTDAAEQAAYSSSTAGSGGSGGGGGITINQYVQGSIWERRALEATAVRAAERAGRGW